MSRMPAPGEKPPRSAKGRPISVGDFKFLSVIGNGVYVSEVLLAEEKASQRLYAVKVYEKKRLIENNEVDNVATETDILIKATQARHPFLVHIHACFQTETKLGLVLEYVGGGDLRFYVQRAHFTQEAARFYGAELCLAIKYLHDNAILHRSIQLENVLLTPDGHVKLTDFIVSKQGMRPNDRTSSFTGSHEFMPPEMLLDKPYSFALDWHSFGILLYTLNCQQAPYHAWPEYGDTDMLPRPVKYYPCNPPPSTKAFLSALLTLDDVRRLGAGPTDAEEVMAHEYFKGTDWDAVFHKRVPVPFIPIMSHAADTRNFDKAYKDLRPSLAEVEEGLEGVTDIDADTLCGSKSDTPAVTPDMQGQFEGFECCMMDREGWSMEASSSISLFSTATTL